MYLGDARRVYTMNLRIITQAPATRTLQSASNRFGSDSRDVCSYGIQRRDMRELALRHVNEVY